MLAFYRLDVPSEPRKLEVEELGADFIHIHWSQPEDEGFCQITGYSVEIQMKGQRTWREVAKVEGDIHDYTITGLQEGKEYNIRVFAKNQVGTSKPNALPTSIKVGLPYSMLDNIFALRSIFFLSTYKDHLHLHNARV